MRPARALVVVVLLLAACATWKTTPPEIVDGERLAVFQTDFLATANRYDYAYRSKLIPEGYYQAWREYVGRAQPVLAKAHDAWQVAAIQGKPLDAQTSADVRAAQRELAILKARVP